MSLTFSVKIYSVGVWNELIAKDKGFDVKLKFTPLEFETPGTKQRAV